jgi:hypothetical protein
MQGLIREARDLQGIRKETAPKRDGDTLPPPPGGASEPPAGGGASPRKKG